MQNDGVTWKLRVEDEVPLALAGQTPETMWDVLEGACMRIAMTGGESYQKGYRY